MLARLPDRSNPLRWSVEVADRVRRLVPIDSLGSARDGLCT
jgi:hypothetical protein